MASAAPRRWGWPIAAGLLIGLMLLNAGLMLGTAGNQKEDNHRTTFASERPQSPRQRHCAVPLRFDRLRRRQGLLHHFRRL